MIIECKNCLRKFKIDEDLLKPTGSKVRCSKCGVVFRVLPPTSGWDNPLLADNDNTYKNDSISNHYNSVWDRRKHQRLEISVPGSCISYDEQDKPVDFNLCRITDLSQEGFEIEVYCSSTTGILSVSYISLSDKEIEIRAKVVHSKQIAAGKLNIGLSFLGTPVEISEFVSNLVRYNHYFNKPTDPTQKMVRSLPDS